MKKVRLLFTMGDSNFRLVVTQRPLSKTSEKVSGDYVEVQKPDAEGQLGWVPAKDAPSLEFIMRHALLQGVMHGELLVPDGTPPILLGKLP